MTCSLCPSFSLCPSLSFSLSLVSLSRLSRSLSVCNKNEGLQIIVRFSWIPMQKSHRSADTQKLYRPKITRTSHSRTLDLTQKVSYQKCVNHQNTKACQKTHLERHRQNTNSPLPRTRQSAHATSPRACPSTR